jgi:amidase
VSFEEQVALFLGLISSAVAVSADPGDADAGPHLRWLQLQEQRARLEQVWAEWFTGRDALLCPVLPVPAFAHVQDGDFMTRTVPIDGEEQPYVSMIAWTGLIGIMKLPSAVAPVGRTEGGLPVGVQAVAPYLRDREAVQLAGSLAEITGGGYRVPAGYA